MPRATQKFPPWAQHMGSRGDIGVSKKMGVGLLGGVCIRESLSAISEIPGYPVLERAYIFGAPKGVGFRGRVRSNPQH